MASLLGVLQFSHIVVPWMVVLRRLRKERPLLAKVKARAKDPKEDVLPAATQTHRCSACGAPVPLSDATFACPHCSAKIVPSPDVIAAHRRMVAAQHLLALAERTWKRAVLWGSPVWVFLFWLGITMWSGVYVYLVIAQSSGPGIRELSRIDRAFYFASAPSGMFGWCLWMVMINELGKFGRVLGKVPRSFFRSLPAEDASCSHCGASVRFENGRLATLCAYCGAEEIRPALAKRAAAEAQSLKTAALASILEAYRAIVTRREALLRYVDAMAVGQIVLVLFDMLSSIPGVGRVLEFIP